MALRVWLPLNGSLENIGVSDIIFTNSNTSFITVDNNGKIGKCYTFNSTANNNGISSVDNGFMDKYINNKSWSICAWIKTTSTDTCVISLSYGLRMFAGDSTHTLISLYNSSRTVSCTSPIAVNDGKWHHLAATYDINTNMINFYIDGINVKATAYTSGYTYASSWTNGLFIGKDPNNSTVNDHYLYKGSLNDIRIYDHCLSAKEVKEIAQGLVLHYKLDGFSGGSGENLALDTVNKINTSTGAGKTVTLDYGLQSNFNLIRGKKITISADIILENAVSTATSGSKRVGFEPAIRYSDNTVQYMGYWIGLDSNPKTLSGRYSTTVTVQDKDFQSIAQNGTYIQGLTSGTATIKNIKVELGDIATPWSPAPADLGIDTTKVTDSSGFGNDGLILNVAPQTTTETSRYSVASKFSTNTSKIKLPVISYSNFGNSYTISWWEYMTTVNGGPMPWGFSDGNRLNCYHTTNLCWNTGDGSSNPFTPTKTSASLIDNKWHFMAVTGDGSATKLYIDGVLHGNATTYKPLTGTQIYISGWDTGTSYTMINNSMNDFRIYATTLSADDIADLYHTSANVDNLQQMHAFEFSENGNATKIYKNGIWETEKIMSSTEGANLFSGSKTTDWRGITAKFDGEYLTLNGTATSALGGNAGTGFYLPITYEAGKQYSYIVSYVSGTATGSGWGIEYYPRGFSNIEINQDNYTTTQYVTRSVSTTTEESNGYSLYGWTTGTTYNNLIMKLQVIEGAYNPDGISTASVYSNKLQAVNFIEK